MLSRKTERALRSEDRQGRSDQRLRQKKLCGGATKATEAEARKAGGPGGVGGSESSLLTHGSLYTACRLGQ